MIYQFTQNGLPPDCHPERNCHPVILNGTKWSEGSVTDSSLTLRMTKRGSVIDDATVILNETEWSEGSVTDSSLTLRMTKRRSAPCHPERNCHPVILNETKWSEGSVQILRLRSFIFP